MNDIGLVTSSSDPTKPRVYELGEPRPGDGMGNQDDHVDDGGRVADVKGKG